jgi:hypothetical protein
VSSAAALRSDQVFRARPFFPAGYFTGFIGGAGLSFFNDAI